MRASCTRSGDTPVADSPTRAALVFVLGSLALASAAGVPPLPVGRLESIRSSGQASVSRRNAHARTCSSGSRNCMLKKSSPAAPVPCSDHSARKRNAGSFSCANISRSSRFASSTPSLVVLRSASASRACRACHSSGARSSATSSCALCLRTSDGIRGGGVSPCVILKMRPLVRCTPVFSWHSPVSLQSSTYTPPSGPSRRSIPRNHGSALSMKSGA